VADASKYQRGSFRGVKFLTESVRTRFGRRAAIYELPFDDSGVAHFDLGRAPRRYSIRAIILGEDYMKERNRFIRALEQGGAGRLVHPYLGQVMVVVQNNVDIEESTAEGSSCTIIFEAIEARDPLPPPDGLSLLDAANNVRESASEAFIKALNAIPGPDVLLQDVTTTLDETNRSMTLLNAKIQSWLEAPGNLAAQIDRISQNLATLINTPSRLFAAIDGFFESLCASISRVSNAATKPGVIAQVQHAAMGRALRGFNTMDAGLVAVPAVATPTREAQRRNRADLVQSLKAAAFANLASALGELPPESRREALNTAG
jgi:prophage DNA circulation protein